MPLATITDALTQYNANPPSTWNSGGAALCLDAVYFLLANRATRMDDQGSTLNYDTLESVKKTLETKLGTSAPRANGRSRRVTAGYSGSDGVQ